MEQKDIEALEPKYTGNERHLTEGEAAEILNEQGRETDEADFLDFVEITPIPAVGRINNPL